MPIFDGLEPRDEEVENFKMNSPNPRRLLLRNKDRIRILESTDSDSFLDRSAISLTGNSSFKDFNNSYQDVGTSTQLDEDIQIVADTSTPLASDINKEPNTEHIIINAMEEPEKQSDQFEDARQSLDDTYEDMQKFEDVSEIVMPDDPPVNELAAKIPHPTGIICTRPEYYTKPTLDELINYISEDGTCVVQGFTIGRIGYGNVRFSEAFDVSNLNIDEFVFFRDKEINIYPDEAKKPSLGQGLNRKAQVTLDKVWPYNKKQKIIVKDVESLVQMDYADRLRKLCEKQGTRFVDYRPETGSWVFKVDHFSKYGHRDSDDSDIDECTDKDLAKIEEAKKPIEEKVLEKVQPDIVAELNEVAGGEDLAQGLNHELLSNADLIASTLKAGLLEDYGLRSPDTSFNLSMGLDPSKKYASRTMFHMSNFDIGKH